MVEAPAAVLEARQQRRERAASVKLIRFITR
jgi:hypothetical protein